LKTAFTDSPEHRHGLSIAKMFQLVSMMLYGPDIPKTTSSSDAKKRLRIFAAAAPYVMTQEQIDTVLEDDFCNEYLASLTDTQVQLQMYRLPQLTREMLNKYVFVEQGLRPSEEIARFIGLSTTAQESILKR
jgi:hypothetical protein